MNIIDISRPFKIINNITKCKENIELATDHDRDELNYRHSVREANVKIILLLNFFLCGDNSLKFSDYSIYIFNVKTTC